MDERLRFLLYGTYDGFSRSTLGDDNILLVLDNGDKVQIPNHFCKNASDFVEKNQIKLKDVIARIKQLDIGTRKVWLDEFLNELGGDYGTLKYKDGYEQGKLEGSMVPYEEPQKVTIPQFVADWIEYCKTDGIALGYALYCSGQASDKKVYDWIVESLENQEIFARAWLDGYTAEKEKKYKVKFKNVRSSTRYLKYDGVIEKWYFGINQDSNVARLCHTKEELEKAGFGEVFNSPLFEIEEVE